MEKIFYNVWTIVIRGIPFAIASGTFLSIVPLIEGILYLVKSEEDFAAKYPPKHKVRFVGSGAL